MMWTPIGYFKEKKDVNVEEQDGIVIVEDIRKTWNELYPCPKENPEITKLKEENSDLLEEVTASCEIINNLKHEMEDLMDSLVAYERINLSLENDVEQLKKNVNKLKKDKDFVKVLYEKTFENYTKTWDFRIKQKIRKVKKWYGK